MSERMRKTTCQLQCAPAVLVAGVLLYAGLGMSVSWTHQHTPGLTQAVRMIFASILVLGAAGLVAGVTTAVSRRPVTRHYRDEDEYDLPPFRRREDAERPAGPGPVPAPAFAPAVILNCKPAPVPEPGLASSVRPERLPARVTEVPG